MPKDETLSHRVINCNSCANLRTSCVRGKTLAAQPGKTQKRTVLGLFWFYRQNFTLS
jgi:hypothetical protein